MHEDINSFNKEHGLASLIGSDKQIAWADKIRQRFVVAIQNVLDRANANSKINEEITMAFELLKKETNASFFIDHRDANSAKDILWFFHEKRLRELAEAEEKELEVVADAEIVLTPAETICKDPIKILVQVGQVVAMFRKHDAVNDLLKDQRYIWHNDNKQWVYKTQSETDRAAELAARLLTIGVPVIMYNEEARYKLDTRTFKIANHKVIGTNDEETMFMVTFPYDEGIEKVVKATFDGRVYSAGKIAVKKAYADDLIEFAEEYGFEFTKRGAKLRDSIPRRVRLIVDTDDLSDLLDD